MRYSIQRVLKPPPKKIELGSIEQLQTLDAFESAKKHRVYIHKEECVDFLMDRTTGKIDAPIKLLSINSVDYILRPGLNEVPGPVFEYLVHNTEQQAAAQEAILPENIKRIHPLMA
jgi:hypothetical protein